MSLNVTCFQGRVWSHCLPVHFLDHIWCLVCYFLSPSAVSSGYLKSVFLLLSLLQPRHRRPPDDPPAWNICPVLFKSFIFSQTRSRWAPLGRVISGGLLSNEREGSLCISGGSQVRDEHSSVVVSSCLICLLSRVLDNKTLIAGSLAPIPSRGFYKGCAAVHRLESHEKMRVFHLNFKQRPAHWLTAHPDDGSSSTPTVQKCNDVYVISTIPFSNKQFGKNKTIAAWGWCAVICFVF